ncbi:sulfatase-like hydrolase/transferase [Leptospira soteropolitanensis]|nr:sulfatase-like hydrolase/transferase [Leptospira soteropolitanensis]MCW7498695.1 LTA synthase family protein [Leptospira soteropolitanensis]MCW7528666.1 LTA synthase family protein [Leptospira soteropolitanensis]
MFFIYLSLYCFQGLFSGAIGVWVYFHGFFLNTFTVVVLILEIYLRNKQIQGIKYSLILRVILWTLYLILLGYQQVYQTSVNFELFLYFFKHIRLLSTDIIGFLYQWKLSQWIVLFIGFYWILNKNRKKIFISLSVVILFFLSFISENEELDVSKYLPVSLSQAKRVKSVLESIHDKPNIVFVLLEGVSRKHLSTQTSKYINFSLLEGAHFWIPMPHTSKSLFTWMTGQSQLNLSRLNIDKSILESSFPVLLHRDHNYQTIMIYTQSIYFEGMESFFPKIFQSVWDKTTLEKEYGSLYSSFSWGMDDRVILSAQKRMIQKTNSPIFVLVGLSQTHSPYFISKNRSESEWKSPSFRYKVALQEEVKVIDSIISYWKEHSSRETVVILSADHGESFGEEGAHAHNYSLYNQETDVPFLLYFVKSGEIYRPKKGSSVDFKTTILGLLDEDKDQVHLDQSKNFFSADYKLNLFSKTWNSEIQKSWITLDKKYIYHSDRDQLLEMDLDDRNRKQVTDVRLKDKLVNQIISGIH